MLLTISDAMEAEKGNFAWFHNLQLADLQFTDQARYLQACNLRTHTWQFVTHNLVYQLPNV